MFDEFRKRVRNWMEKAKADTGIAKEFKDIFSWAVSLLLINFTISEYLFGSIYTKDFIARGTGF